MTARRREPRRSSLPTRVIAVIGAPWSRAELALAVEDAAALSARLCLVDTAAGLASTDPAVDCERLTVADLDPVTLAGALTGRRPDCVVSITELTTERAARVRELLGMSGTPADVEACVIDKLATRAALRAAGLSNVRCWETSVGQLAALVADLPLPVVVKPRAFTGSHGVRLVAHPADLAAALSVYEPELAARHGRDRVLVEAYVPGPEISAEALVVDGRASLLAMTDKVTTEPPVFFEVGHVQPSRHFPTWRARVADYLQRATAALGIVTSPIHAELKLVDGAVELVELHTRWGGGTIVELMQRTLGIRPYRMLFAAILDGVPPEVSAGTGQLHGVGFFGGRPDRPLRWRSFDFPRPEAVRSIDFDATRRPPVRAHEGIRLEHWRAGTVTFTSDDRDAITADIEFLRRQVQDAYADSGVDNGRARRLVGRT